MLQLKYSLLLKCFFLFWITIPAADSSFGQCGCDSIIHYYTTAIKNNYAGFRYKTDKHYDEYSRFERKLKMRATKDSMVNCLDLISEYFSYFNDPHLRISKKAALSFKPEKVSIVELDSLLSSPTNKKEMEGLWQSDDNSYRVYIKQHKNVAGKYVGVVLSSKNKNWNKGDIKFYINRITLNKYKALYFSGDYSSSISFAAFSNDSILYMKNAGVWKKDQGHLQPDTAIVKNDSTFEQLNIKKTDNKNIVIRIPSFDIQEKRSIDSLIFQYDSLLKTTENLIIDVRGNLGGSTDCYEKLLPYIYTNPIKVSESYVSSSPENIAKSKVLVEQAKKILSAEQMEFATKKIQKMELHKGTFLTEKQGEIVFDTVYKFPKKVAILIDNNSASSTELFLLSCMQSKKVVLYGQNTRGAIDYGDLILYEDPCAEYEAYIPMTRRSFKLYKPIDNIGISPDVYISNFNSNWIFFVQKDLLKNK